MLQDTVILDLDASTLTPPSPPSPPLPSFIGSSGSLAKQGMEMMKQVKEGLFGASFLFGGGAAGGTSDRAGAGSDTPVGQMNGAAALNDGEDRDVVATMFADMRTVSMRKGMTSVMGGGGVEGSDGGVWMVGAEKILRNMMALFYLFYVGDIDRIISLVLDEEIRRQDATSAVPVGAPSNSGNSAQRYRSCPLPIERIRERFMHYRTAKGDSREVLAFLHEWIHASMFDRFVQVQRRQMYPLPSAASTAEEDNAASMDLFEAARKIMRQSDTVINTGTFHEKEVMG